LETRNKITEIRKTTTGEAEKMAISMGAFVVTVPALLPIIDTGGVREGDACSALLHVWHTASALLKVLSIKLELFCSECPTHNITDKWL
jgi:hypothetical protein